MQMVVFRHCEPRRGEAISKYGRDCFASFLATAALLAMTVASGGDYA
jgi:hypothetical protein